MRALLAAAALCVMLVPARAQWGEGSPPAEWPKPPADWMEMAPGVPESAYDTIYYAMKPGPQQPGAQPNKGFDLTQPVAKWMSELKRPNAPTNSCCGPADAYEIEIIKEGGDADFWDVKIVHGESREYPDGTKRPPLPNGTIFHIRPERVTKPAQWNPTKTAWLFVAVSYHAVTAYCLVPLPPSY